MSRTVDRSALDLARVIAAVADAEHGTDVLVLEVGDVLGVTEYFVIVSASNRRLVRTLVDEVEKPRSQARLLNHARQGEHSLKDLGSGFLITGS